MTDTLMHRGPDSRGTWYDPVRGIGLGYRRLAIRDLTASGEQPMTSSCGRLVIVYNGEVYSHNEIAGELAHTGRQLAGHSDTEVILEAFAEWGVAPVVRRLIGMFAFALYDKESGDLFLVRDRLGIKPLYWSVVDNLLIFGSELKALRRMPGWSPRIDRDAFAAFMRHNYIPAPRTIYRDVQKLEPGTILKVGRDGTISTERYWDLRSIVETGVRTPAEVDDEPAIDHLESLLLDAVRRRLVSDVPVGALLSGGIDSSLVTALMAESSGAKIKTFSIGFAEKGFDEAPYAREVARHLGTEHTELYAEPGHALAMVERLPYWYDEPFADSSQLPTALVCALTRNHVAVVLSGDGGDELFAGYSRYAYALDLWANTKRAPSAMRTLLASCMLAAPGGLLDAAGKLLPGRFSRGGFGSKVKHLAMAALEDDPDRLYRRMLSQWCEPDAVVLGGHEPRGVLWDEGLARTVPDFLDRMMLVDMLTYLPDDILTKVDRASMSVALEARVPLLDHRVVEYAWALPQRLKLRDGVSKWALRKILYRRVPPPLLERRKMGFDIPLAAWLRGPLREWADALLAEDRLKQQGLLNSAYVSERWRAFLRGTDWAYPLWNVLMAQAWIEANPEVTV